MKLECGCCANFWADGVRDRVRKPHLPSSYMQRTRPKHPRLKLYLSVAAWLRERELTDFMEMGREEMKNRKGKNKL